MLHNTSVRQDLGYCTLFAPSQHQWWNVMWLRCSVWTSENPQSRRITEEHGAKKHGGWNTGFKWSQRKMNAWKKTPDGPRKMLLDWLKKENKTHYSQQKRKPEDRADWRHRRGSSVNFRGARHFCPKKYVWKIDKMPEFYMILAGKIIKIREFFNDICRKN